jgi:cystathionine beta-synthase
LPVLEGEALVGILDELDLLQAVSNERENFTRPVRDFMTTNLETLPPSADPSALMSLFDRDLVPIVVHEGRLLGLITKIDYINYLRRRNHG